MTLESRIAALEGAARDGLLSVVVHGGLRAQLGPDNTAKAAGTTWTRGEGEDVAEFRARVLGEAKAAGAKVLVWG